MQMGARLSGKNAKIICMAPDVCLTPVGSSIVPIPYMIISELNWSTRTVSHTSFTGMESFNTHSRTNKVTGDEPGSKGGVKSGVNKGWCRPKSKKTSIFVDGKQLLHNDNLYEMNCSGPEGPSNTIGRLNYPQG